MCADCVNAKCLPAVAACAGLPAWYFDLRPPGIGSNNTATSHTNTTNNANTTNNNDDDDDDDDTGTEKNGDAIVREYDDWQKLLRQLSAETMTTSTPAFRGGAAVVTLGDFLTDFSDDDDDDELAATGAASNPSASQRVVTVGGSINRPFFLRP